jgi:hypothetical protein
MWTEMFTDSGETTGGKNPKGLPTSERWLTENKQVFSTGRTDSLDMRENENLRNSTHKSTDNMNGDSDSNRNEGELLPTTTPLIN